MFATTLGPVFAAYGDGTDEAISNCVMRRNYDRLENHKVMRHLPHEKLKEVLKKYTAGIKGRNM